MKENKLIKAFQRNGDGLLSVFYTAGYPSLNDTEEIARRLEKGGVDFLEIGIPFSDPIADGPVIQESSQVALRNGMNVRLLLSQVRSMRSSIQIPILLMGYLNPVLRFGFNDFCREAAAAGVDGVILPDLPLDEYEADFQAPLESAGLAPIFLVAPATTPKRVRRIDKLSHAFIYAVAASRTTGVSDDFGPDQIGYFERLRAMRLSHPFLTGFGIGDAVQFKKACEYSSGAIVGSAFINLLKKHGRPGDFIEDFVQRMKGIPAEVMG